MVKLEAEILHHEQPTCGERAWKLETIHSSLTFKRWLLVNHTAEMKCDCSVLEVTDKETSDKNHRKVMRTREQLK
ncbi:MAG: hypothetical protein ATN35_01565 [Epulopiscium sp. Nele67-Bin004]|nr:MAG: hypothetical protein ATN35_01565 [Epulopiscium sp. Nele67-Bin004]